MKARRKSKSPSIVWRMPHIVGWMCRNGIFIIDSHSTSRIRSRCEVHFEYLWAAHTSVLYTRAASLHALTSIAHHFLEVDKLPYKLQPGGPGYEIVYSTTAVIPYLLSLDANANSLEASFNAITAYEQKLIEPLLGFLTAPEQFEKGVKVVGVIRLDWRGHLLFPLL
jgi:hypothetical protein